MYKDEDCGSHGRCIDVGGTSPPVMQCFCQLGYYGPGCSAKSPKDDKDIQYGLYTKK
jgi:EGF-like domain